MEYVRIDNKSEREVFDYTNILAERIAKFQSRGKTGHLGNKKILNM